MAAEELVRRVAELERTQRAEDVEGFLALLAEDCVWVTGGGRRLVGRAEIATFTRAVLPGAFAAGSVRYDVELVRFLGPDVALTAVRQQYLTGDGLPGPRGLPSYVWRRDGDRWLIAAGQNTGVPPEPEPGIRPEDEAALRRVVADVEEGFNGNDPEPMLRHVAADAVLTGVSGAVLRGRAEIDAATRAGLAGPLRTATAHYRLTDLALLGPDVAVARKEAWSTRAAADAGEAPEMTALYVFARRDGRWWIVRRQNTLVRS